MDNLRLFEHVYVDNKAEKTLFLFHGTGGDKEDLLFLNDFLSEKYNLVGMQGNVTEHGMHRFFRRHGFGIFDQDNIREEVGKLEKFILYWRSSYNLTLENSFFLGYSNGANILLALLFYYPSLLSHLVLAHPMIPFEIEKGSIDLSAHTIFLTTGDHDEMISESEQKKLIALLESCKANLMVQHYSAGHEISNTELNDIQRYLYDY
jgi:phospholipase/carboxylesterase